jgi:class 3 adenylate cyclase
MRCAKCASDNRDGRKFCAKCGVALAHQCARCGASNKPGEDFCGECGAALTAIAVAGASLPQAASAIPDIRITPEQPDTSKVIDGERKTVTALFADIKGSTELMRDLDPEEARAIIDPALKLMIDAAHRYDGYVVQSTGDGIFALFGAPVAHEDHPQRALYAAVATCDELRRRDEDLRMVGRAGVEVRIGINTGEVVMRTVQTGGHTEYSPVGHVINLASRMQSVAPSGGIVVSEETRGLVEGYFNLRDLGTTEVRGINEPINVYEVVGVGALHGHFDRAARRGLTKFIGRERELEQIQRALELVMSGHGQIVTVMAEAGTGKSRLLHEFKATIPIACKVLEAYSVSHGKASAWLPVLELLRDYFDIQDADEPTTRREKIRAALAALDPALRDALPYLFGLLGIVDGPDPLAQMDPQIKRRRTLDAIKRVILRESLNQPLVVIFEDLHWIDEQTQALLDLLADGIASARVLLLVNYRPEYRHEWGSKSHYAQLGLNPLNRESAEELLAALLEDAVELLPLKRLVIERTGGNPFFMEETVQALFDEGALVRGGVGLSLTKPLDALKIPPTVQGILAARIDRLPPDAKELLQTLAVIGREFALSLIHAVISKSEDELNRLLNDLQLGEFIYEQPAVGDTDYIFKHALTQEVAYNSLLIERRQQLHERAAVAVESLHVSSIEEHLAELAHHYDRSANPDKAVQYLTRAGQQARNRSAFAEAQVQLQRGLEWIKKLSESPERDVRELELASILAQVLTVTRGHTAPETRAIAERARDLAEKGGNLAQLIAQVFGIFRGAIVAGDLSTGALLAERILDLAQREGSPASLGCACYAQVYGSFFRGDLIGLEEHFARLGGFLFAAGFRQVPGAAVAAFGTAGFCAAASGNVDSARKRTAQAMAFARESNNPYDLAMSRVFESWLYCWLREPQRAEVAATQALNIDEEHGFPFI